MDDLQFALLRARILIRKISPGRVLGGAAQLMEPLEATG
jgi:hypothetical protein